MLQLIVIAGLLLLSGGFKVRQHLVLAAEQRRLRKSRVPRGQYVEVERLMSGVAVERVSIP